MPRTARNRMIFALPQPQSGLLLLLLQGEGDEEEEEEKEKGAFGGVPYYGATNLVRGVPTWVWGAHAGGGTGAFGGAPHGATKRVRDVPKWAGSHMRPPPLRPSVELPLGPRHA